MNDTTQPQHFTLRSGSSTLGSPGRSRASLQSGFRVQAQTNYTPRPFFWDLNPAPVPAELRASSRSSGRQSRLLRQATTSPKTSSGLDQELFTLLKPSTALFWCGPLAGQALAVGEDLDPLDETGGVRSGRPVRVSDSKGDLDRLGVNEQGAAG